MDAFLAKLELVFSKIKAVCISFIDIAVFVGVSLILSDILIGTTFGTLGRLVQALSTVGISGNILTILIVVALVLKYKK